MHPTYQVPCLWFRLSGLPAHEQPFNIDTVFRRLVPDQYKDGLRAAGVTGGISFDVWARCFVLKFCCQDGSTEWFRVVRQV